MNSFAKDDNNEEILLSSQTHQVMMEWEKPYMEASIDFLEPKGHVLEIGFGCGYSATQILKHPIKSYTVIECDPVVIAKAKLWRENRPVPIEIIEGTWQEKLPLVGVFDEIYFDDFPLNIDENSKEYDIQISKKRLSIFIDLCIQNHTKIGSKISFYLNHNNKVVLSSDSEPFVTIESEVIDTKIPDNCKYRDTNDQKCTIPLVTKIAEYDFQIASQYALEQIKKM